jgi:hypothetical protein
MKKKRPIPNPHDAFFRRIFGRPEAAEAFIYLLLEHKSAPDERVALQLLRYVAQAWDRLPAPLPLIVPVVVYHGAAPWRVDRSLSGLFDPAVRESVWRRYLPDFEYYLCDLSRYSDEELKGAEGLAAALKLLKHIFRSDLPEKLPEVFIETARDLPEERALDQVKTMVSYLTESQRVTESQIENALLTARSEGGRMETVFDRMEKKLIQRGRQEGAAELILSMLRRQIGVLEQTVEDRISALPVAKLKRLGEDLPGFKSLDDLEKWLRRYAPMPTRRVKVTKSQGRKKASQK